MAKTVGKPFEGDFPESQLFGVNPARYAQFGMVGHDGVDYATPTGTPIISGVEGKVVKTTNTRGGYGKSVTVWDPAQNLSVIYAHLSEFSLKVGDKVSPGSPIGKSGNTGNSTGPHLHIGTGETDISGNRINRGNGYDGWLNPATATTPGTPPKTTTKGGDEVQSAPGYTGPPPPPYAPTHAGQTVSSGGNNFRSDDGKTWIFGGSDAERRAAQRANDARETYESNQKMTDAGVYLHKANLTKRYPEGQHHPSNDGLRDAWRLVIKGNWRARLDPGGPGNAPQRWFENPGEYMLNPERGDENWKIGTIEARPKPAPPAPKPIPDLKATEVVKTQIAPPAPSTPTPPGVAYTPWTGKGAPGTRRVYNLIVAVANRQALSSGV